MTSRKRILLFAVTSLILSFVLIAFLLLIHLLNENQFKSIILGWIITTINVGLGIVSIKSGINKSEKIFMQRIFGGMVIRFMTILIMVVLALLLLELNRITFIFSVLFYYIFYLIIEIIYLNFIQN
jgi:hypothetical protein